MDVEDWKSKVEGWTLKDFDDDFKRKREEEERTVMDNNQKKENIPREAKSIEYYNRGMDHEKEGGRLGTLSKE